MTESPNPQKPMDLSVLYPDLVKARGLLQALREAFRQQPQIEIDGFGKGETWARLELGGRFATVAIGAVQRIFLPSFHEPHSFEASGKTPNFPELVNSLSAWLIQGISTAELISTFPFCEENKKKPAATDQESWDQLAVFVNSFKKDHWHDWKNTMNDLLSSGIAEGLNQSFRAGQSMADLVFSTQDYHGLDRPNTPRVTVAYKGGNELKISYGYGNGKPGEAHIVPRKRAFVVFKRLLRRLWMETKEGLPIPDCLNVDKLD